MQKPPAAQDAGASGTGEGSSNWLSRWKQRQEIRKSHYALSFIHIYYLIEKEELAEYEELIRRLYEAISSLPPMQARRVHARYMLGMKVKDIAAMEGITPAQAGKSIHAALRRLRRYFARQKWTVNL